MQSAQHTPVADEAEPKSREDSVTALGPTRWPSDSSLAAVLILVVLLCYANMLTNGFVYDDDQQILQNPYVKSWRFLPEIFSTTVWSFVGQAGTTNYYRPLMTLSFLVQWQIFGPIPFGFHLFSLTLQAAVVVMIFLAGITIFHDRRIAWCSALLFAIHPIHTEAVDWIAAQPDLEATLFVLVALWQFAKPGRSGKRLVLMLGTFALALLAKEPSLMLVPLLVAFEHTLRQDPEGVGFRHKAARYLPLCILGATYLGIRVILFGKVAPVLQHPSITWPQAVYSAFALVLGYARLLVWPVRLSAFHVFHVSTSLWEPQVLGGVLLAGVWVVALLWSWRRAPSAAFAILWMGVTLVPVLNARWLAANVLAERYLYLPSVGFCWLLAWCGVRLWDSGWQQAFAFKYGRVAVALLFAASFVLGVTATIMRNRDWSTDIALYTRTLDTDPDAHIIRSNRAGIYFEEGDFQRAESEWKWALAGKPDNVLTMNALGMLYTKEKRYDEGRAIFQKAIATRPLWADAHYNYATLLHTTGDEAQAYAQFEKATELAPLNPVARLCYGKALLDDSRTAEAEVQLQKAQQLQPSVDTLRLLAQVYLQSGRSKQAEATLRQVLGQKPYDGECHLEMAKLMEAEGRREEAKREYQSVLLTDPENSEAKNAITRLTSP